jgi:signal transduction histidine kinase
VDAIRHRAEEKGLQVHVKTPKDTTVELMSDRESFSRILDVLLDNAIRYTDEGEILVEVTRRSQGIEVRVRDTGRGIPPENHEGIFDMFSQGAHGLVGSHEGFGIGLSIAAGRAELIGATLAVESEVGVGSVFTLLIPEKDSGSSEAKPGTHKSETETESAS